MIDIGDQGPGKAGDNPVDSARSGTYSLSGTYTLGSAIRHLRPLVLLAALVMLWSWQDLIFPPGSKRPENRQQQAASDRGSASDSPSDPLQKPGGLQSIAAIPTAITTEAQPFVYDPEVLANIVDGDTITDLMTGSLKIIDEDTPSERQGIAYLFHKLRTEPADHGEEAAFLPDYLTGYRGNEAQLRGKRFAFSGRMLDDVQVRTLPENPSGIRTYYDAFLEGSDERFYRVMYYDNDPAPKIGEWVDADLIFLRMYCYWSNHEQSPVWVPQFVSSGFRYTSVPPSTWDGGILVLLGIGVAGMVLLFMRRKDMASEAAFQRKRDRQLNRRSRRRSRRRT